MQIQLNTDRNVQGRQDLAAYVQELLERALERFRDQITRIEVHLGDENSRHKGGEDDKRCMMEVRLAGRQPTAVTHQAATVDEALRGAADKLERVIEKTLGRLQDQR